MLLCRYLLPDKMWDSHDERIAHAERAMAIGHADICPTPRKALQLVEFVWNKATITPIDFHNMLEARWKSVV